MGRCHQRHPISNQRSRLGTTALFTGGPSVTTSCTAALGNCPNYLLGTITNNEAWDVMAKYTFDVPSFFGAAEAVSTKDAPRGSLKDAPSAPATAKVTIYGGYQYVDQSNPDNPQYSYSGNTTIGGYRYVATGINAFGSDRIRATAWAGLSYVVDLGALSVLTTTTGKLLPEQRCGGVEPCAP